MDTAASRPDETPARRLLRRLAPALLLAIIAALAPLWWQATAPPLLATIRPWRDTAGTLLVPFASLRPPGPQAQVEPAGPANLFVVRDGMARRTRVQLGAIRGGQVEIRGGLDATAVLVANPPIGLEDRHRITARP